MKRLILVLALLLVASTASAAIYYAGAFRPRPPFTACANGIDDDGDGASDYPADSGCSSASDTSELALGTECDNGLDDDGDGDIDYPDDAQCANSSDNQEAGAPAVACNDTIDNDGDGATDYPADTGCTSAADTNELNLGVECDDGLDNDSDTFTDYPDDSGCTSSADNTEAAAVLPACSNTLDDDGDTFTDYPADPGCSSPTDIYEFSFAQCDNNLDDDGDTFTDYPDDADCTSPADLTEATDLPLPHCNDLTDNDGDGFSDYPDDAGCDGVDDDTETDPTLPCDNSEDDDGDGTADFRTSGGDPGCSSLTDPSETFGTQCDDGVDNDGDGQTDYPADPNCTASTDDSEAADVPSGLTADIEVSYMQGTSSCIAPCPIFVDATATDDTSVDNDFRDLVYEVDCGAGATGTFSDGSSRRYRRGPLTGCVYESDGAHTITLTVTNPATGTTDTDTSGITVSAITSAFTGANIHCFSNDTDHTGCPSGATQHSTVTNFNTALATTCNADGAKVACLFKRDDTFTGSGVTLYNGSIGTIGIVGAYGTGADPVVTGTTGIGPNPNWIVANLAITVTSGNVISSMGPDRDRFVVHEVVGRGGSGCYSTTTGSAGSRFNTLEALIDYDCRRDIDGSGSTFFHRGEKFLALGGVWDTNNYGEFVYRTVGLVKGVFQNITMRQPGPGSRNALQFRTWAQSTNVEDPSGVGPPPTPNQYIVVSDNVIEFNSANTIRLCQNNDCTSIGANGAGQPMDNTDYLIERNFFHSNPNFVGSVNLATGLHGQGGRVTIRNNVFDLQGLDSGAIVRITQQQVNYADCFLCSDDEWVTQGNTVYYDEDLDIPTDFCTAASGTGHQCDLNLLHRPNDASVSGDDWNAGSGTFNSVTGNLRTGAVNPFDVSPPGEGFSVMTDFILSAGSAARNQGGPSGRLDRDACFAIRPNSTSHDAGAWEQGATCP